MATKLGSRSTAFDALCGADLSGKTAIITGGNSGIGTETARALALAGAHVIITSRNLDAGNAVAKEIKESGVKGSVEAVQLDLTDLASVQACSQQLVSKAPKIDFLVLNAGVMACPLMYTKNGFEMQIGTNHLGHFAFAQPLAEVMRKQNFPSRVVVLSSLAHNFEKLDLEDLHWTKRTYGPWVAYGASKLANVLYAKQLALRLKDSQVSAYSVHPGSIATNLSRHVLKPGGIGDRLARFILSIFLKTPMQGAATTVYACLSRDLEGQSGAYLADCRVVLPSKRAQDRELAEQLWTITEQQLAAAHAAQKQ